MGFIIYLIKLFYIELNICYFFDIYSVINIDLDIK